ncbi:hypothetical protein [Priestia megaterium]|uniref:hypothetical protein n=1 Tax=Priestia megaterium TaxID=1404 RepID=UPI002877F7A8|nr:hypothetical protein [Priestia megaterium]
MSTNKGEVVLGEIKYSHKTDEKYDYLTDESDNEIKVNLRFTKNNQKNKIAMNGLKAFFLGISS